MSPLPMPQPSQGDSREPRADRGLYGAACRRTLMPACRSWLVSGGPAG